MTAILRLIFSVSIFTLSLSAFAHSFEFGAKGTTQKPLSLEADQGIECSSKENWCEAKGNVDVIQGDATLKSDVLKAHFQPQQNAPKGEDPLSQLSKGLTILDATGNVTIKSPNGTATGSRAIYTAKTGCVDLSGPNAHLKTPTETLTAKTSLQYCSLGEAPTAKTVGRSKLIKDDKTIEADSLNATFKTSSSKTILDTAKGSGNVQIFSKDAIIFADSGIYTAINDNVALEGNVKITRGKNQLEGDYGTMNIKTGLASILSAPPGAKAPVRRVKALIIPNASKVK